MFILNGIIPVCVLDKLYFQRSSAHTFDTLYFVKSATLHVSATILRKTSSQNVARITSIKMENYKFQI